MYLMQNMKKILVRLFLNGMRLKIWGTHSQAENFSMLEILVTSNSTVCH
jgi:hypothetical protein